MLLESIAGVTALGSFLSGRSARRRQREALANQASLQRTAAWRTEQDMFAEADAARSQQLLIAQREGLAEDAAEEARRQARLAEGPIDITLGGRPIRGRRGLFFDEVAQ